MKKTIIQWVQRITKSPFIKKFIKKTSWAVSILGATIEIQECFFTSMNSTLSVRSRAVAAIRGSSCFGALITSYCAIKSSNPEVKVAFQVWCYILGGIFILSGGEMGLSLIFAHNAKNIN